MIIVLMGVSGAGKTVVGRELAWQLDYQFIDADDYHPAANVAKMHAGVPLDDDDRRPWLEALRRVIDDAHSGGKNIVLACSALKHSYQEYLSGHSLVHYVWLAGSEELIAHRLAKRKGHFMNPKLLHSQFETLEPPEHAIQVDITPPPAEIAAEIRRRLGL